MGFVLENRRTDGRDDLLRALVLRLSDVIEAQVTRLLLVQMHRSEKNRLWNGIGAGNVVQSHPTGDRGYVRGSLNRRTMLETLGVPRGEDAGDQQENQAGQHHEDGKLR